MQAKETKRWEIAKKEDSFLKNTLLLVKMVI